MVAGASGTSFLWVKNSFLNLFYLERQNCMKYISRFFFPSRRMKNVKVKSVKKDPIFFFLAQNPIKGLCCQATSQANIIKLLDWKICVTSDGFELSSDSARHKLSSSRNSARLGSGWVKKKCTTLRLYSFKDINPRIKIEFKRS